jgi:hypothetical protein
MVFDDTKEFLSESGQDVAKVRELRALSDNYNFRYSQLNDLYESVLKGDKEAEQRLIVEQEEVNNETVKVAKEMGIDVFYDKGELLVEVVGEDGEKTLKNLDEETFANIAASVGAAGGETSGAITGTITGAIQGAKWGKSPRMKALSTVTGAAIGGYTGTLLGSMMDLTRSAITLNKKIDALEIFNIATGRAVADTVIGAGTAIVAKPVIGAFKSIKAFPGRAKTLIKQGNIKGAQRVVKEDYGLTDENIDTLFDSVKKDIPNLEDLKGDDLIRAKLTAAVQQQAQGKATIVSAIRNNAKAAIETSKEIDMRAKEVMHSVSKFSKKPSQIGKSVKAYEKVVARNYKDVKNLINEALPN